MKDVPLRTDRDDILVVLARLVRTALFAALGGSLALAAGLRAFIMSAASCLG